MSIPKYVAGDIVYLIESAKVGFLESYQVAAVSMVVGNNWQYTIAVPARSPSGATYGDRNQLKRGFDFQLDESELITYCEALTYAESYLQSQLTKIQSLKAAQCGSE